MDNALFISSLEECKDQLATHLQASGVRACCHCNKAFTSARKPQGIARYSHTNTLNEGNAWTYLLCRKCTRIAKQSNNIVHSSLFKKALSEQALLVATVKGTA